jgi:hypothetical protein
MSKPGTIWPPHMSPDAVCRRRILADASVGAPTNDPGWGPPALEHRECVLDQPFSRMQDPSKRAERYEKMAEEFAELAKDASSPFLRAYYQRIAEQYHMHAEGELRAIEQEGAL